MREDLTSPAKVCDISVAQIQDILKEEVPDEATAKLYDDVAQEIHGVATELLKPEYGGIVPKTKDQLLGLGLNLNTASLLMHVFGSTDLVINLHVQKVVTACDMFDWEETRATSKKKVKMKNILDNDVTKSLLTWLPKEEFVGFYDTMDSIGSLLASTTAQGTWGQINKAINMFAPKDKEKLEKMTKNIRQFYLATRPGGKKTRSCS